MKRKTISILLGVAACACINPITQGFGQIQNLTNGLVAYWPLDTTNQWGETPDLVNGYNLKIYYKDKSTTNRWAADTLYFTNDAVRGKSVHFPYWTGAPRVTGGNNTNATGYMLAYKASPGDKIPINAYTPTNWTISLWVKCSDNHPYNDNDQRIWTEGNYDNNTPTFNICPMGTQMRVFLRHSGSPPYLNFQTWAYTINVAYGDQTNTWSTGNGWRNITIVQKREDNNTGTNDANRYIYIDGILVADSTGLTQSIGGKPDGLWNLNTFCLGGWLRPAVPDVAFLTNACIDEVAVWERALTEEEIHFYITNGIGVDLGGGQAPLRVQLFKPDLALQLPGESNVLRWEVNPDVTKVEITPGVGDVTSRTVNGMGWVPINPQETTTYQIKIYRGQNDTASASATVRVIAYSSAGWRIIDDFDTLPNGPLMNQNNWQSVIGGIYGGSHIPMVVTQCVDGNKVLAAAGAPLLSGCILNQRAIQLGSSNTLFFRFYIDPSINQLKEYYYSTIDMLIGIGDTKAGGFLSQGQYFDYINNGPSIRINRETDWEAGPINLMAYWGPFGNAGTFSILDQVAPTGLTVGVVYNVWIDVFRTNDAANNISAYYSVHIQREGIDAQRITLFENQPADRAAEGAVENPYDHVFVVARNLTGQGTNEIRFDDFYISTDGFRSDKPVPARSFITGNPTLPSTVRIVSAARTANGIELRWESIPGAFFTIERRAAVDTGGWVPIATGISSGGNVTTWVDTNPPSTGAFYRVRSP